MVMRKATSPTKQRSKRGGVFLESLMSLFVLGLGASAFFSLLPTMQRSKHIANNSSIALQLAGRMIEQVQLLKKRDLNAKTLTQLNLIDANQTGSPYSFSRVPLDDASRYSPAQLLRNGTGIMTMTTLASGSVKVDLTISWTSASGRTASINTGTIIGAYK